MFFKNLLKKVLLVVVFSLFLLFQAPVQTVFAADLTEDLRTLPINPAGDIKVYSIQEIGQGERTFNASCAQCHVRGITKTNPNVGLAPQDLEGAVPARDNVAALVDYMKNPTTYDGAFEIYEFHPSIRSADIFPKMRNLTETDLEQIAAYILLQPRVQGERWGGGKYTY
ncbi:MAG: photosystem II cytochrome c-550 [Prochlorotrichaceae cyanobacterium]